VSLCVSTNVLNGLAYDHAIDNKITEKSMAHLVPPRIAWFSRNNVKNCKNVRSVLATSTPSGLSAVKRTRAEKTRVAM